MKRKTDPTLPTRLGTHPLLSALLLIGLMLLTVDLDAAESIVIFQRDKGVELCRFTAELARSPQEIERGLMFRKSLGNRAGMLFIFSEDAPRYFWMKNTLIPLDLVFIDSRMKVVHVHAGARPLDESPLPSNAAARYVLEVNAGRAADCGIITGTQVRFLNIIR
jgi:uncharacterized protein